MEPRAGKTMESSQENTEDLTLLYPSVTYNEKMLEMYRRKFQDLLLDGLTERSPGP